MLANSDDDGTEPAVAASITVVEATQRDLVEFDELAASMVYADVRVVSTETVATVTDVVDPGATLIRGDVVVELDGRPVALFYGAVPLYRPLSVGAEGDDVLLLERNLAALGHHTELDDEDNEVATGFTVDGVFDESTEEAVTRWQEDLGLPPTGETSPTDVVVTPGQIDVLDVTVDLGDRTQPGAGLVEYTTGSVTETFHAEHDGDIDVEVAAGDAIASGEVLYTVDGRPVIALVADDAVDVDRDLEAGIDPGEDVVVLETMLVERGFDAGGDLDVDDEFTEETAEALAEFWDDLADRYDDVEIADSLRLDDIVVVESGTTVGALADHDADVLASGSVLWSSTAGETARIVTTELPVADQADLALGQRVEVEFPDGTVVGGTVSDVARTSVLDPQAPDAEPVLPIEISLDTVPDAAAAFNELDVTVLVTDQVAEDAVVVPVTALVALGGGDYAVEIVSADGTTTFVAVTVGMFADGDVEVTGIDAGQNVVVP